jgi:UDP-3-O-[3-hydroxymyristoyl] glucosamine N-acyltransferase
VVQPAAEEVLLRVNTPGAYTEANRVLPRLNDKFLARPPLVDPAARLAANAQVGADAMVGAAATVGERAVVKRSIVGRAGPECDPPVSS